MLRPEVCWGLTIEVWMLVFFPDISPYVCLVLGFSFWGSLLWSEDFGFLGLRLCRVCWGGGGALGVDDQ